MTKSPDEDYFDYIKRLRGNALAKKVKLADLQHNSDLTRLDCPMKQDYLRREKYLKALVILLEEPEKVRRTKIRLTNDAPIFLSIYQRGSTITKYSIDFEFAKDSHYEFDAENGEKLCAALNPNLSLADALGQLMPVSKLKMAATLRQCGIQFTQHHFY